MSILLKPLRLENFDDFSNLFSLTDSSGCYCASWRSMDATWETRCKDPSKPNRELTYESVKDGIHVGYLIYDEHVPIGWTGAGPKTSFPSMRDERLGARLSPFTPETWVLGCIGIENESDSKDQIADIVIALIQEAKRHGAKRFEANPTLPWDEERAYRGSYEMYKELGFEICGRESDGSSEILLMSLTL